MNTGIIASRYATALLKLVDETGSGETVVAQVQLLLDALESVPELRRAVDDSTSVSAAQKMALFETVVPGLSGNLRRFLELLIHNGRIGDSTLIFNSFLGLYYKSRGIVRGRLAVPDYSSGTATLETRLKDLVEQKTGQRLLLTTEVDPSLLGGFVFELEDRLLDASVSHQLDIIKRQFIDKNRRIV